MSAAKGRALLDQRGVRASGGVTASQRSRTPMLLGAALTIVGIAVVVLGLRGTDAGATEFGEGTLTRSLMVMFVGAVMFSFGSMMLLVALVRPLFARRPADDAADRLR